MKTKILEQVRDLVDFIMAGDETSATTEFQNILMSKVVSRLEDLKVDVAHEHFNLSSEVDESFSEGTYKSGLGFDIHHGKDKVTQYDTNGNKTVKFSVDGGRKKSLQIPPSMSISDKNPSPSELNDKHPLVKLISNHLKEEVESVNEGMPPVAVHVDGKHFRTYTGLTTWDAIKKAKEDNPEISNKKVHAIKTPIKVG